MIKITPPRTISFPSRRGGKRKALEDAVRKGATLVKPMSREPLLGMSGRLQSSLYILWLYRTGELEHV